MPQYTLEDVFEQRKLKNFEKAKEIMKLILENDSQNPYYNYHMAWCHDNLGEESAAVQYYEKAINIGLDDETLKEAYIGLGSTYRVLGAFEKSKKVFETAIEKYPNINSLKVFYAMTLYNLNQNQKSISFLLDVINKTTTDEEIQKYKRAINYYKDNLDEIIRE